MAPLTTHTALAINAPPEVSPPPEPAEDEATCSEALGRLKKWLDEQKHITCRRDNSFLLRFLRCRKYHVLDARDQLEKYLKMRQDHSKWFSNLDIRDPKLADLINGGYYFALPERDNFGRRVLFNRTAALDPNRNTTVEQMRVMLLCFETMLEDETNQKLGFTYVLDEKDVGLAHISMWNVSDVSKAIHCCEKTVPMRHKVVHLLNLSTTFGTIFELVKSLLSFKMNSRLKVHSDINSLHKSIDPKILPKEYGGVVPMATMIKLYREEAEAVRSSVLSLDQMNVRKASKESGGSTSNTFNKIQRSFRKLDID